MIERLTAGIVGLLAFVGMLAAGCLAGNTFTTIVARSLRGLFGGLLLGYVAGKLAKLLVTENVKKMIEADADAELAAEKPGPDGAEAPNQPENSVETTGGNKETGENSREILGQGKTATVAARASRELFGRT